MSITLALRPLVYRAHSRIRPVERTADPRSGALERVIIAPALSQLTPAAISLASEIDRATASIISSSLEAERQRAAMHVAVSHPTIAYRYSNALIARGCWYANGNYEASHNHRRYWPAIGRVQHFSEAQLCTDWTSEKFFGHWLCDGLSMELLAADRRLTGLTFDGVKRIHEAQYRELFSLEATNVSVAHVRTFWVIDDRGYNQHRIDRLLRLRKRLRGKVTATGDRLVFIDRGTSGVARSLVNRDEVIERLLTMGFVVISPETMTSRAIAESLAGARLAVGVEGSNLNHALMALPEGAGLLAIQPPDRLNLFNNHVAHCARLRFGFTVAEACEGGFKLDVDRLLRTVDLF